MTHTQLFKKLGAALRNVRWSWGAVRESDGAVFLLVWQDRIKPIDGKQYVQVSHRAKYADNPDNRGHVERQQHIALIMSGSPSYLVMCIAKDVKAKPRTVGSFFDDEVFSGGELVENDGEQWLELRNRIPVSRVILTTAAKA